MQLSKESIIDFGKHNGKKLKELPRRYWFFLAGFIIHVASRIKIESSAYEWIKKNKMEYVEFANQVLHRKCWYCYKPLASVGNWRSNGKSGKIDWESRYLHTSCWRLLRSREYYEPDCWRTRKNRPLWDLD